MMKKKKNLLFISAGDPLGIGPEVLVKALQSPLVRQRYTPVIIGEKQTLCQAGLTADLAELIPIDSPFPRPKKPGPSRWGGDISFKALKLACKLAAAHRCAVVTAPISKQSWTKADIEFTGHTEFLRRYYGRNALMMFVAGPLRCALVSEHFAIADLPAVLTRKRIVASAKNFSQALKNLGIKNPHIAISALNPHGGDNGKFGTQETTTIIPAIKTLQKNSVLAQGPYPIDSLWSKHTQGQFDGILCMYHDQALLGLKLAAKEPIIHITAGLDILRVSPTHGTAFDIAGKNLADPSGMLAAILFAAKH